MQNGMSALPPKADMCSATRYVRFVPKADIAPGSLPERRTIKRKLFSADFDYLISAATASAIMSQRYRLLEEAPVGKISLATEFYLRNVCLIAPASKAVTTTGRTTWERSGLRCSGCSRQG